jgi:hypothetical protein
MTMREIRVTALIQLFSRGLTFWARAGFRPDWYKYVYEWILARDPGALVAAEFPMIQRARTNSRRLSKWPGDTWSILSAAGPSRRLPLVPDDRR